MARPIANRPPRSLRDQPHFGFLAEARNVFDIVLIDCPPGLSVLTESWLREADFHISPTKPDYISACGLEVFRRFKTLNPEMGFARNLGVVVNMKDTMSAADADYHAWLAGNPANNCFMNVIPRANALQDASRFVADGRSYFAKYPGATGAAIKSLTEEFLARIASENALTQATSASARTTPPALPVQGSTEPPPLTTTG